MLGRASHTAACKILLRSATWNWHKGTRYTPQTCVQFIKCQTVHQLRARHVCSADSSGKHDGNYNSGSRGDAFQHADGSHDDSRSSRSADADVKDPSELVHEQIQSGDNAKQVKENSARTYREIVSTWIASRETDLRGLASESSLAIRDFLVDPSLTLFGRSYSVSQLKDLTNVDFDLQKFTGSFKRIADLTAWYPAAQQQSVDAEIAAAQNVTSRKQEWQKGDGLHPAAIAFQNQNLGFGFSAGGLLFSYYIGVVFGLHDLGVITRDTKLGGSSAGSLIAACYHSALPQDIIIANCFKLAENCRTNGTRGRLGIVLKEFLDNLLPEDIHERCNDRAFVAVTKVWPRPTSVLVSEFESKQDLVSALMTSCHVPLWFDSRPWTTFRGAACYDGGLTNFIPIPPSEYGVRVCCFPAKQLNSVYEIQISPDSFTEWEHGMKQMMSWAFEPADEQMLNQFVVKGRADAKAWAEHCGILELIPKSEQPNPAEVERDGQQKSRMVETEDSTAKAVH